jgi:UDP-glucose 4-epimerase
MIRKMQRYLVTGGGGFIGSHLVEALVRQGHHVRVLDNFSTGNRANLSSVMENVDVIAGDLCDEQAVKRSVAGVDAIFHQAALASVPLSVEDPLATHAACATGTVALLHHAQRAGVRRVIYAASSSAYGNLSWSSKRETDLPMPLSPYAAAKLAAEQYCAAFFYSYGLETVCLRYFNVFGPRQDPNGAYAAVIPRFITQMLAGEPPIVFGDGKQSRDFTYVENVVAGNLAAAKAVNVGGKVFNIASGVSYSLLDLISALNRLLGTHYEPQFEPARTGDVRDSLADISAARRELAYEPLVDFAGGLERTIASFRPSN